MGTISEKLTYLNTTKTNLKDMINYGLPTEEQITSSTTFRNYVTSIFNAFLEALRTPDTLFTNLPKITGSGSNITLNGTANAPMRITLNPTALSQDGTPTPDSPQDIHTISGSNSIVVSDGNGVSQTNTIDLTPYNLGSIGNYENRIFKNVSGDTDYSSEREEGAWYYKEGIGKVVLDGTESGWQLFFSTSGIFINSSLISSLSSLGTINCICNYYSNEYSRAYIRSYLDSVDNACATNGLELIIANKNITTTTDFKTWLSTHNTIVYYILATPTYTKITGELAEQLEQVNRGMLSYDGTTNISQVNNDLPFTLGVSALEDLS